MLATDADLGENAQIRFSLVPNSREHHVLFTIDPVSGDIYTTDTFDREKLGEYTITVRATDQPISAQGRYESSNLLLDDFCSSKRTTKIHFPPRTLFLSWSMHRLALTGKTTIISFLLFIFLFRENEGIPFILL